jgi:hypothetical protein
MCNVRDCSAGVIRRVTPNLQLHQMLLEGVEYFSNGKALSVVAAFLHGTLGGHIGTINRNYHRVYLDNR